MGQVRAVPVGLTWSRVITMTMPAVVLTIDLLATGLLVVDDLTSVVAPLPGTLAAFDDLQAGRIMKALIAPNW
jgi:hypothetical protein